MNRTSSDSQFTFKHSYEDDFYDDGSEDDSFEEDSGVEEKLIYRKSYNTPSSTNVSSKTKTSSSHITKKNSSKISSIYSHKTSNYLASNTTLNELHRIKTKRRTRSFNSKGTVTKAKGNGRSTPDIIIKRVLSVNRKRTSELHNIIYELRQQLRELTIDNKDLKRDYHLQDHDLRKLYDSEAHLPVLVRNHSNEINTIQEKLKREKKV